MGCPSWTGDGKPDKLTAKYAAGVDVFVTEMAVDNVALWALKQGVSPFIGAFTLDNFHTSHYAAGYLANPHPAATRNGDAPVL